VTAGPCCGASLISAVSPISAARSAPGLPCGARPGSPASTAPMSVAADRRFRKAAFTPATSRGPSISAASSIWCKASKWPSICRSGAARGFVETLTCHGDLVLLSAQPPGQGGEHHVNDQPYDYWRVRFAAQGYMLTDWLPRQPAELPQVHYWYHCNLFLFGSVERLASLPGTMQCAVQPEGEPVADLSPPSFRLRKRLLQRVRSPIRNRLSRALSRLRGGGSA
jgi:hypothetical protein